MANVYDQILAKLSPEEAKIVRDRQNKSDSAVTRLKGEAQRAKDKGNSLNRKLTLSRPSLAVTEFIKDSRKQTHEVEVVQLLNKEQYAQLRFLVAPLIEVALKALQGTEITRVHTVMQVDQNGKRTDKPMIGGDGKPIVIPSTLESIQKFYMNILNNDSFKKLLDEVRIEASKLALAEPDNPLFKRYAPRQNVENQADTNSNSSGRKSSGR